MSGIEKKKQMRGPLGKVFFLKFKDILMINAGKDIKENSTAEPCRYLNAKMYNIEGKMYKLQIYFKRQLKEATTDAADVVEKFFMRK